MNGRAAGVGFPVLMGAYLLYSNLTESKLFTESPEAAYRKSVRVAGAPESAHPRTLAIARRVEFKVASPCFNPLESVPAVMGTGWIRTA
jgi:hypothetical protein